MAVIGMALEVMASEGDDSVKEVLVRKLLHGLTIDELASLQIACEGLRRIASEIWKDVKKDRYSRPVA